RRLAVRQLVHREDGRHDRAEIEVVSEHAERQLGRPRLDEKVLPKIVSELPDEVVAHVEAAKDVHAFVSYCTTDFVEGDFEPHIDDDSSSVVSHGVLPVPTRAASEEPDQTHGLTSISRSSHH